MSTDSSRAQLQADIVVIGGGPAGATAGRLLAEWGLDVVLLAGPRRATPRLAESLPPSTRALLDTLHLLDRVDRAGFLRATGNTVWWGAGEPRVERFASNDASGWQVPRAAFDQLLLDFAEESGVRVLRGTTARDVEFVDLDGRARAMMPARDAEADDRYDRARAASDADAPPGTADLANGVSSAASLGVAGAIVHGSRAGGEAIEIAARLVIDASGRTGVLARRALRRDEPGHQTVALAAAWRAPGGWTLPDDTHTLVEAFEDGWAWSIPISRTIRYFTVMVDRGAWRGGARGYATAIDKAMHLRALLGQGTLAGAPWGAEASLYCAERAAGPGFLLAGDAAATLDPLSSFGVKKALASGWMAAIVANTCLTRPAMADAARALFDAREREVYAAGLAGAVAFARDAVQTFPSNFWRARAATALDGRAIGPIEDRFRHDEGVRAAFARLRASDGATLRAAIAPGAPIEPRPMIDGREVVMAESILLPAAPEGVRYFGGVNLPALVALVCDAPRDVPALFDAYLRTQPAVDLARFLTALAVLISSGSIEIVASSRPMDTFVR